MTTPALLAILLLTPPQDEARRWADRLGSEDVRERSEAARRLKELGAAAVPALQAAARDADVERASTARRLLRALEIRGRLTPALLALHPGLEDRLAADDHAWTELFLELTRRSPEGDPAHPSVRIADLEAVVVDALRHARPEELLDLCDGRVVGARCRGAIPVLRELLRAQPPAPLRRRLAGSLGQFGAAEAAPELLGLLKDPDPLVRRAAVAALAEVNHAPAVPGLLERLGDPEQIVRLDAVLALGSLRATAAVPRLLPLLASEHPQERRYAIEALLDLDAAEAAGPALVRLLGHEDASTRSSAAWALGYLGHRPAVPGIRGLLKDADAGVRAGAAEALGVLGDDASIPDLIRLLADPAPFDGIRWRGSTLVVGRTHPATLSIEALGRLGAADAAPALAKLLKDPDSELAVPAAEWLCSLGSPEGVPLLVAARNPSIFLNAPERPEEWRKLRGARVRERWRGTARQLVDRAARAAGLEVVWPATPSPSFENSMECRHEVGRWDAVSAAELLDRLSFTWSFLLEEGRLRVVERPEALRHWDARRK